MGKKTIPAKRPAAAASAATAPRAAKTVLMTRDAAARISLRAGVLRQTRPGKDAARAAAAYILYRVMRNAMVIADNSKRRTLKADDVREAIIATGANKVYGTAAE